MVLIESFFALSARSFFTYRNAVLCRGVAEQTCKENKLHDVFSFLVVVHNVELVVGVWVFVFVDLCIVSKGRKVDDRMWFGGGGPFATSFSLFAVRSVILP